MAHSLSALQEESKQIQYLMASVDTFTERFDSRYYVSNPVHMDAHYQAPSAADALALFTAALGWRCTQEAAEWIAKEAPAGFIEDALDAAKGVSDYLVAEKQLNDKLVNHILAAIEHLDTCLSSRLDASDPSLVQITQLKTQFMDSVLHSSAALRGDVPTQNLHQKKKALLEDRKVFLKLFLLLLQMIAYEKPGEIFFKMCVFI